MVQGSDNVCEGCLAPPGCTAECRRGHLLSVGVSPALRPAELLETGGSLLESVHEKLPKLFFRAQGLDMLDVDLFLEYCLKIS